MNIHKKQAALGMLLTLLFSSHVTLAENTSSTIKNYYYGASYSSLDYQEKGTSDASLASLNLNAGYIFNESLSFEARLGLGVGDDNINFNLLNTTVSGEIELDQTMGIYGKYAMPVEQYAPYVILGYSSAEATAKVSSMSASSVSASSDVASMSYGLGLDVQISKRMTGNLEYINLLDKSDVEISAITLGVSFKF
ncbi:outer membrane beta-barrel protein [Aliikangiella sp. IMCC44359]|uniref:outer membrane beta-barrel protein n=1 Tax=Aliikangiella sp. IMCC44359 TaxID=3459125 RepID=UPI00403AC344